MEFIDRTNFLPRIDQIYSELEIKLLQILPCARIEHVGSSAIPGAISKGDLDIFVGVNISDFLNAIALISSIGFREKLDTLRTESLCMMTTLDYNEDVAVQIVANGSEYESFLKFRDTLRSHPDLVAKYNVLKMNCRGMSHDMYRDIKSEFIESVLNAH